MGTYENIGRVFTSKKMPFGRIGITDHDDFNSSPSQSLVLACKSEDNFFSSNRNEEGAVLVAVPIERESPYLLGDHFDLIYVTKSKFVLQIDYDTRQKYRNGSAKADKEFQLNRNAIWISKEGGSFLVGNRFHVNLDTMEIFPRRPDFEFCIPVNNWRFTIDNLYDATVFWPRQQ
ncbi:MAG: hypothetical protein ACSHX3_13485 [Litorimonas sp.]